MKFLVVLTTVLSIGFTAYAEDNAPKENNSSTKTLTDEEAMELCMLAVEQTVAVEVARCIALADLEITAREILILRLVEENKSLKAQLKELGVEPKSSPKADDVDKRNSI